MRRLRLRIVSIFRYAPRSAVSRTSGRSGIVRKDVRASWWQSVFLSLFSLGLQSYGINPVCQNVNSGFEWFVYSHSNRNFVANTRFSHHCEKPKCHFQRIFCFQKVSRTMVSYALGWGVCKPAGCSALQKDIAFLCFFSLQIAEKEVFSAVRFSVFRRVFRRHVDNGIPSCWEKKRFLSRTKNFSQPNKMPFCLMNAKI